jgi:glucosylglycerate synthase
MRSGPQIVIGLPSFNEAHNIARLTSQIDDALRQRGLTSRAILVNSDNSSPDGTAATFRATPTRTRKLSLTATQPGKGSNLHTIFAAAAHLDAAHTILIDTDIRSFEVSWLDGLLGKLDEGFDFVLPAYARDMFEGNSTNHLVAPLIHALTGYYIKQPLAGDCALSARFAHHLLEQDWSRGARTYGIETFMALNACLGPFAIAEIALPKKLHSPSFHKAIRIYEEVAYTAFAMLATPPASSAKPARLALLDDAKVELLDSAPPEPQKLAGRQADALYALDQVLAAPVTLPGITADWLAETAATTLHSGAYAHVLATFYASLTQGAEPRALMQALKPLFLLRSCDFIEEHRYHSPRIAVEDLRQMHELLKLELAAAGLSAAGPDPQTRIEPTPDAIS